MYVATPEYRFNTTKDSRIDGLSRREDEALHVGMAELGEAPLLRGAYDALVPVSCIPVRQN